jgi:mono/diheme cytochrome c family protein
LFEIKALAHRPRQISDVLPASAKRGSMRTTTLLCALVIVVGCASPPAQSRNQMDPLAAEGQFLVQVHCGDCHAYRHDDRSKHPDAPLLRTLDRNYPVSALEGALAAGIVVGHPDMPEYRFRPEDVTAIVGYLETIQE